VHEKGPSPDNYSPRASMAEDVKSNHKKVPRARFGLNTFDELNKQWAMKEMSATPGPG